MDIYLADNMTGCFGIYNYYSCMYMEDRVKIEQGLNIIMVKTVNTSSNRTHTSCHFDISPGFLYCILSKI